MPRATPVHHFSHSGGIRIIGKRTGYIELVRHQLCQWDHTLPGQVGRIFDGAIVIVAIRRTNTNATDSIDTTHFIDGWHQRIIQFINVISDIIVFARGYGAPIGDIATMIYDAKYRVGSTYINTDCKLLPLTDCHDNLL